MVNLKIYLKVEFSFKTKISLTLILNTGPDPIDNGENIIM